MQLFLSNVKCSINFFFLANITFSKSNNYYQNYAEIHVFVAVFSMTMKNL